ncbi:MAG: hypothetical protein AMJ69_04955 [Gammaproteobacteria bacterium SG8_47]|nr:MAG: hypothetical protein AMJ69_04955 [Gammaproteobacteria bacterium SG8_47]
MDEARFVELLVELHKGLPRLGPGNAESTLRALNLCVHLPDAPDVLDIGCGSGVQTLILARAAKGCITATDLIPEFLVQLKAFVSKAGLQQRVRVCQADMNNLPFADATFDLVWSEGAAYIMGIDNALAAWRRLLRPRGYLVVSEACWFKPDPPEELKAFWAEGYPAMRGIVPNLDAARRLGWETIANFHLPTEGWTVDYYRPLKIRLPGFREAYAGDSDAQELADMTEYEMSIIERYPDFCGYEFFILRRGD